MNPWSEIPVRTKLLQTFGLTVGLGLFGCSGSDSLTLPGGGGDQGKGGNTPSGSGGATSVGTTTPGGGSASTGGAGVGGSVATGGMVATGGNKPAVGGATGAGGTPNTGGTMPAGAGGAPTGGSVATGGMPTAAGGAATGGKAATGGAAMGGAATGGKAATGGAAMGGAATGGKAATGGAATGGGTAVNCSGTPLTGGTQHCASGSGNVGNGYVWEVWLSPNATGTNCSTVYGVGAAFKATWNLSSGMDFLARVGLSFDRTQTYDQIGTISADYAFTKTGTGQAFVGIYGWSFTPLIEYYIIEDWITARPAYPNSKMGTITVDGGTYDVYTNTQVNQSSPLGYTTFQQFWSVRQTGHQCGHVSINQHFFQWASLGMQLGFLGESKLLLESLNGSGTVDFTSATVVVN